jgi:uncharacterized protein
MMTIVERLHESVDRLEIIDTHEHLPASDAARDRNVDVLKEYLAHYFNKDLMSAGLTKENFLRVIDTELPLMDRWRLVAPYWELARNTGYGRSLDLSVKGIYGFERIDGNTIEPLNAAFQESLKPGHFEKVLKQKSRISVSLLDSHLDCDRSLFRSVFRMDNYIFPSNDSDLRSMEKETGVGICSFDDWLLSCETLLDLALSRGAVALKSGLAYRRTLRFERVSKSEAEESFNEIFKYIHIQNRTFDILIAGKKFQDYMMHYVLRLANKRHLTFQFHTGLLEGNGNVIGNSDPSLLVNLFLEYPNVKFDLFHIGYPYQHVLSALAKSFPNVYIDMCWAHIISPTACVESLREWLDSVPVNKICAFGGDYLFVDGVYGHQLLARHNVCRSLAAKVEEGVFDLDRAAEVARMLFVDNPMELFGLQDSVGK